MQFPFTLRRDAEFDAIGFGTNAVDYLIRVPHYPTFNSKVELTDYVQAAGGEVASTMVGLRRLGLRTSYIGRFGTDPAADIGMSSLSAEGVDLSWAGKVEGAATQIAFIIIDDRSGERTVIWKRDARLAYSADEAPVEAAVRARVLHLTPHDVEACIRMARAARAAGTIVSVDIDSLFPGIDELLASVDVLITAADLPEKLTGIADPRCGVEEMGRRYGASVAGVTLGEAGSLVVCGGRAFETPAYPVPHGCRDTTGAGDAFRAGLLYGILTGMTVEDSCRAANAVASLKCRALGARTTLPTESELHSMLRT